MEEEVRRAGVSGVRRLKQLEDENVKPKRQVADLGVERRSCSLCSKDDLTPGQHRGLVGYARDAYRVTERRACRVLCMSRATFRYVFVGHGQEELLMRVKEIAAVSPEPGLATDPRAAGTRWLAGQPRAHGASLLNE